MAVELSAKTKLLLNQTHKGPNLILEIDGIDTVYSALDIFELARFDADPLLYFDDPDLWFDKGVKKLNANSFISLSGSGAKIQNQLMHDQGASSSISTLNIEIVDLDGSISRIVTPGIELTDILNRSCVVYLNFQGGLHPEDSIVIHRGIVSKVKNTPVSSVLQISHPERKKKQKIFLPSNTNLNGPAEYRSKIIQSIRYITKSDVDGTVSIEYIGGGTSGSEVVTVVGNAITVQIEDGVSTASKIRNKIEAKQEAVALVETKIESGESGTVQNIQALTQLTSDTTITVNSTEGFLEPSDCLETYIRIGDELIKYTGLTSTTFTGCTRGSLESTPIHHADDDEVQSVYRLNENALDLALKLMISGSGQYGQTDVLYFGGFSPSELDSSIIMFNYFDIQKKLGFTVGDSIIVSGATNGGNNGTFTILDYGKNDIGSWVQVDAVLVTELDTAGSATFQSQYDVLNDGMAMTPIEVDVIRHEDLLFKFSSSIPTYDFRLSEEIDGEWIANQVYFPANLYAIPRESKASVGITAPPIADDEIVFLDETNIYNPSSLSPERSLNENFYNTVVTKYGYDTIDNRFLNGYINYSGDSQNRFNTVESKLGNNPLTIESYGLRPEIAQTSTIISINSRNILDRFQYAPEKIEGVKVLSKSGWALEVGDIVAFGSPDLKILNISSGARDGEIKFYEVVDKSLDVKTSDITLTLLSTSFDANGRYALISHSTLVDSGSTTTAIRIKPSFGSSDISDEVDKWVDFVGQEIRIFNSSYSYDEVTTLVSLDSADPFVMNVSPALPSPPSADYTIELPLYDDGSNLFQQKQKLIYCHFMPQLTVVSGISATQFTVSAGDAAKMQVGSIINIHNSDYSVDSDEVLVTDITGTTITVQSLGFTPSTGQLIELIGFNDGGKPYRIYVG